MKKIDLSAQILKKINSSNTPQFKTINDVDKVSQYNMLQYAIFLTKYGDMQNLSEEEYLYLLENIDFKTNNSEPNAYFPMDTLDLIYGISQGQKLVLTANFLNKLHTFHTKPFIFKGNRVVLQLTLARSLLDFPNIEPSSWMWLVEKNMKKASLKDFSAPAVKRYLLDFCISSKCAYLFNGSHSKKSAKKVIDYLMAASERELLSKSLEPKNNSFNPENQKTVMKI